MLKRLRKFALALDRLHWKTEVAYPFYLASRPLCSFIDRGLKKNAIYLTSSSKFGILGSVCETSSFTINSSQVAVLTIPFDLNVYQHLTTTDSKHCFFVNLSKKTLRSSSEFPQDQVELLVALIDSFAESGYVSEWQAATRSIRTLGMKAELHCSMTSTEFTLTLRVFKEALLVFKKTILQTDPDEIAYHYKFKELQVSGDELIVTARTGGKPLTTVHFNEILYHQQPDDAQPIIPPDLSRQAAPVR